MYMRCCTSQQIKTYGSMLHVFEAHACVPANQSTSVHGMWHGNTVCVNAVEACVCVCVTACECKYQCGSSPSNPPPHPTPPPRSLLSTWCFLVLSLSGWCSIFIQPGMTPTLPHPSDGAILSIPPSSVEDTLLLLLYVCVCAGVSASERNVKYNVQNTYIHIFSLRLLNAMCVSYKFPCSNSIWVKIWCYLATILHRENCLCNACSVAFVCCKVLYSTLLNYYN